MRRCSGAARRSGGDLSTLDVWDEHLAAAGAELVHARMALVAELRPWVAAAYADVAGNDEIVDLVYRSTIPVPGSPAGSHAAPAADPRSAVLIDGATVPPEVPSAAHLQEWMQAELLTVRSRELDRGISLVGPHRDDLELLLAGGPAKGYASHGESWSFALALRLGAFALLRSDGVDPVLVLDDVFAELDVTRRNRLAALIADADQVLITAAVAADVPTELGGVRLMITADGAAPAA
jgi:DNA replication and repair protein RecF